MVARRFEDLREKIAYRLLEPRHLRGKAEQQNFRIGNRLVLKPIERLLGQALEQCIIFSADFAHHVTRFVRGLKCSPPDLLTAYLIEKCEIFHEAGDKIAFGEKRVHWEVDLKTLVQFEQPCA